MSVEVVTVPPVPEMIVHKPVPTVGAFPDKVAVVNPQIPEPVWSAPAVATVGFCWKQTTTSSELSLQGELLIVHRKV